MKKLSTLFILIMIGLVQSCMSFNFFDTKVERWPDRSQEQQSRELTFLEMDNIFSDFNWTTPPITSVRIQDSFQFARETFLITEGEGEILITYDGQEYKFQEERSNGDIYPDISHLQLRSRLVQKWVPKTEIVFETVPVQKSRTVPVTTTSFDGSISTTFRTEFYTDFETRAVPKTSWVWETNTEFYYEIPDFDFFQVEIGEFKFLIYSMKNNGSIELHLQNPQYLMATEMNESFWGENEVNLLFIDGNANGILMEDGDYMLFNVWNPYDPNSHYREIRHVMDNQWYQNQAIGENLFLHLSRNEDILQINYLNEEFLDSEDLGSIGFDSVKQYGEEQDSKYSIEINGREYFLLLGTTLKAEYGHYKLRITMENQMDFIKYFTINEDNPHLDIHYQSPGPAGSVKLENVFSDNFFVVVSYNEDRFAFYNDRTFNLPPGESQVEITLGGYSLIKTVNIEVGEEVIIDFEREIQAASSAE